MNAKRTIGRIINKNLLILTSVNGVATDLDSTLKTWLACHLTELNIIEKLPKAIYLTIPQGIKRKPSGNNPQVFLYKDTTFF